LANHANYNAAVGYLTDVGAYAGTTSPSSAFDMAGNLYQWNESSFGDGIRDARGGAYGGSNLPMLSSHLSGFEPQTIRSTTPCTDRDHVHR
jgi:hypothetical protein